VTDVSDAVLDERGLRGQGTIEPTGLLVLSGETFDLLFVSMARSYTIAFCLISVLMLILIGQLRLGSLSILPNLTPILLVLGLMGWVDAALDISSMLVGGILIGVVVDDTIHFAHNYARYRLQRTCSLAAIRETLATTGRAMLVTSVVLSIGFFAFTGASLSNVADFGLLCGIGVLLAFLADVVMLPALVAIVAPCAADCPAHGKEARVAT
jgi:predicted RND superfamily exporter protein